MTISTEDRKAGPFEGNDSTTVFPFAFKVFKAADLLVVRRNEIAELDQTLVLTTDYTVSLNADQNATPGGSITLVAGPLASNFSLVISSDLPLLQETDLTNQGGFYPKVITNALDRLTIFCQQLSEKLGRSLTLPITSPDGVSTELPFPQARYVIGWDDAATALRNFSPEELATIVAYGDTAADQFTGDGSTTTFTLSSAPGSLNNLDVSINGATQRPGFDYSWDFGTHIVFAVAPPAPGVPGAKNVLVRYALALPQTDNALREELGKIVTTVNTVADIPPVLAVGARVNTLGRYAIGKGPGEYVITAGVSAYPLVDPQILPDRYAKLLPLRGTNYDYSLLAAGGKDNLTVDSSTSTALNQLLAKIWAESPLFGGLIRAEAGHYYLTATVSRPAIGAKNIGIVGEYSPMTYGSFESKTIFYSDNSLVGGYVFDFYETQFITLSDFAVRGDVGATPARSGIRFGKDGTPQASGYANHLVERINLSNLYDCLFFKNSGISTVRDVQVAHFEGRGVTLETSGDSNLYNIYANDGAKDTALTSLGIGVGIYVGLGSNNVNVFGGKLEYNSKGFVSHGANGVSLIGVQFDANKMANHIVKSIDDGSQACRGNTAVGCRYLSGGVLAGYQKAGIYIDATAGSATLSISGGGLQSAGDGAYDSSTSGLLGPEVGIYALGNATYTLNVEGAGMVLESPGTVNAVVANGFGVRVKLSGTGGKKTVQELNNGKAHVGFYAERTDTIALLGTSGSATYSVAQCDTVVSDGVATMDIHINVASVSSLAGALSIGALPYSNTGALTACAAMGMTASVSNAPNGLYGYVAPGDNKVTLWKRDSTGGVATLQGTDIAPGSLIRLSVQMKVA